jgi:hypothetical protein
LSSLSGTERTAEGEGAVARQTDNMPKGHPLKPCYPAGG